MNAQTQNPVTQLLFAMYTENTGAHFLDSGGSYGRHHERNKGLTIEAALALDNVSFEVNEYKRKGERKITRELIYSINVFKYLVSAELELDEVCNTFNAIQDAENDEDFNGECYGVSIKAGGYLNSLDATIERGWNTYNDSAQTLSQVLQGSYVSIDKQRYLILQIHGGCDVRGGYTTAKLFKFADNSEGYLRPADIYGSIDGINVDTCDNGYSLVDENHNEVKIKKNSKIELDLTPY